MRAVLSDRRFEDFEEMTDAWKADGWGAHYRQLAPGPFQGRLLVSAVESSVIYRGRWNSAVQHQGLQPKGTVALAPTLFTQGQGRFMGEPMGPHDIVIQASDTALELLGAETWDAAVLVLPEADLAQELAAVTQQDPQPILEHQALAAIEPETSCRIRAACLAYFDAVERSLAATREEVPLAGLARDLVSMVVGAVADSRITPVPGPDAARRRRILRKVEEYAAAGELRIPAVCKAVGVSERSLRYAFQDLLGMSPATYLKLQRLNRARLALHDADPARTLVKQVAYHHGFWHLGQFAHDYKRLFGESPSETLASG